jgi:uncharacterized protein YndB with AHSA1/START domain
MNGNDMIHTEITVHVPLGQAWSYWTLPEHITHWNFASKDWQCPQAVNDLRVGGGFNYRMEAKDQSMGFDFYGVYDEVEEFAKIDYTLGDNRKVKIQFIPVGEGTRILQDFQAENENSVDLQKFGWQAIMNQFKEYAEKNNMKAV